LKRLVAGGWLAFFVCLTVACSGPDEGSSVARPDDATPAPTLEASASPEATVSPVAATNGADPDGERILENVRRLSAEPRRAGSDAEWAASEYLAGLLRNLGYDVSFQEFSSTSPANRNTLLTIESPNPDTIPSFPMGGSALGLVRAPLVNVPGLGRPADFGADARGAIVLIERGELEFREKVANAQAAGALGVVIFNNAPGSFFGGFQPEARIPVISIAQTFGQSLRTLLQQGAVEAELSVTDGSTSRNVIAKPPGRECETISGGHYDSVPQAPGANDNASGTATVVEIAAILARSGNMGANCFVLFAAEEVGLLGSRAYVDSLDRAARDRIKAMLNFDMVGVGEDGWELIGSAELQTRAQALASGLGIATARSSLAGTGASSDHASFIEAGIPALMFYRSDDPA
jgi:hypothetical protein